MSNYLFAKNIEFILRKKGLSVSQMLAELGIPEGHLLTILSKSNNKTLIAAYLHSDIASLSYFDISLPSGCEALIDPQGKASFLEKTIEKSKNDFSSWRILSFREIKTEYFNNEDVFRMIGFRLEQQDYHFDIYAIMQYCEETPHSSEEQMLMNSHIHACVTIDDNPDYYHLYFHEPEDEKILFNLLLTHFQITLDDWYTDWYTFFHPQYRLNNHFCKKEYDLCHIMEKSAVQKILLEEFGENFRNDLYLSRCLTAITTKLESDDLTPAVYMLHNDIPLKKSPLIPKPYSIIENKAIVIRSVEEANQFIIDLITGNLPAELANDPLIELIRIWKYYWADSLSMWNPSSKDWVVAHQWFLWIRDYYTIQTDKSWNSLYEKMNLLPLTKSDLIKKTNRRISTSKHSLYAFGTVSNSHVHSLHMNGDVNVLLKAFITNPDLLKQPKGGTFDEKEWKNNITLLYQLSLYTLSKQLPVTYGIKALSEGKVFVKDEEEKRELFAGLHLSSSTLESLFYVFNPHFIDESTIVNKKDLNNDKYIWFSRGHFEKRDLTVDAYYLAKVITRLIKKNLLYWFSIDIKVNFNIETLNKKVSYIVFSDKMIQDIDSIIKSTVRIVILNVEEARNSYFRVRNEYRKLKERDKRLLETQVANLVNATAEYLSFEK